MRGSRPADVVPPGEGTAALVAMAVAVSLVPLSSSMLTVALLDVESDFRVGVGTATWLVSGYLAAMAVAQPLGGRIGDRAGHRRAFLVGLVGFLACSVLAPGSPTFWVLVTLRLGQALFGALMLPSTSALIREAVGPDRRGRAYGVLATALALAAAAGPLVGGLVVGLVGWRGLFLIPVPVGLAVLPGVLRIRPAPPAHVPGHGPSALRAAGTVLRRRAFSLAAATILFHNLVLYTVLLMVPVLAHDRLGLGHGRAGALAGVTTVGVLAGSLLGGRMADRHGRRRPALLGGLLAVAGGAPLPLLVEHPTVWGIALPLLVVGAGIGLAGPALQAAAVEAAPAGTVAVAGGIYMSARYVGGIAAGLAASVLLGQGQHWAAVLAGVVAVGAALSAATAVGLPSGRHWHVAGAPPG